MMGFTRYILYFSLLLPGVEGSIAQVRVLDSGMHHLRTGFGPEWNGFGQTPRRELKILFQAEINPVDFTLDLVQEDVRYNWKLYLNGKETGSLLNDEQAMKVYVNLPANSLRNGENELIIRQSDTANDDIRVGRIYLHDTSPDKLLHQGNLNLKIKDKKTGQPVPARITVTHQGKALQPLGARTGREIAVRTGVAYTASGKVSFGLPAGIYMVYASRGTAYSVDSFSLNLVSGQSISRILTIEKELPTEGWISCDPHLHTFTWSRHGDASMEERLITIAGEEIDLPVFTDHNLHVRPDSVLRSMQYNPPYTPVTGNEFTTHLGHFNTFPVSAGEPVADPAVRNWEDVKNRLLNGRTDRVVILNHARDQHVGFRPFGDERHISVAGLSRDKQQFPANAMEVMNSGSQQHDRMELVRDWFGMMNAGNFLTPVGSSDSHDVFRYIAGQSRTYISYRRTDPSKIDVEQAVRNFLQGKVMVSFGLLTMIKVNDRFGPGEIVALKNQVIVDVTVYGPSWLGAEKISLYANGKKIREEKISKRSGPLKWRGQYQLPKISQDYFLVAVAEGPGKSLPYWPVPNPYQKTSADWNPGIIGISGAIWIDADGDGKANSAKDYAVKLFESAGNDPVKIKNVLAAFDEAVAAQYAALLYQQSMTDVIEKTISLKDLSPDTGKGFRDFLEAAKR